jgi:hypothetical protein
MLRQPLTKLELNRLIKFVNISIQDTNDEIPDDRELNDEFIGEYTED